MTQFQTISRTEIIERIAAAYRDTAFNGAPQFRIRFDPLPGGRHKLAMMVNEDNFQAIVDMPAPPEFDKPFTGVIDQDSALQWIQGMLNLLEHNVKRRRSKFHLVSGSDPTRANPFLSK